MEAGTLRNHDTSPGACRDYMEQLVVRSKASLVIAAAVIAGLAGCSSVPNAVNPVSWYRDLSGASKNDDLGKGDNDQNLQAGSDQPYPNLASVPEAPSNTLSSVDRDKMVNSLVADRNHAQYSDDDLQPGRVTGTAPPVPPPPSAAPTATPSTTTASVPPSAVAPIPSSPLVPTPSVASTPPLPSSATTRPRAASRGSEAPPAESTLSSPTARAMPQGETVNPAPPPPNVGRFASAAPPAAATRPTPRPSPQPETVSVPANSAPAAKSHAPAISYRVADVSFGPGSALVSGALRGTIAEIVKLHNDSGGRIRIVGFGEGGGTSAMDRLTLALDRAQAVSVALTDSGVAAKDISVEAAPVPARGGSDIPRAEVYFEN